MIEIDGPRGCGVAASGIFHRARREPCLATAVQTATRQWWRATTAQMGRRYCCTWLHRHPIDGRAAAPGWFAFYAGARQAAERVRWSRQAVADGFEVHSIWLGNPNEVFWLAARTFGLNCRVCGQLHQHDTWNSVFVCAKCARRADRQGGIDALLCRKIVTEVRRLRRAGEHRAVPHG